MFKGLKRRLVASGAVLVLGATPALAHFCTVADKPTAAGLQVVFDATSDEAEVVWVSKGVQQRFQQLGEDKFIETFHGWIGLDFDKDRVADAAVLLPGTGEGHLPLSAYENGADCHGVLTLGDYFMDCA